MLDSKLSQADGSALVEIKRVLRGVIYGSVEREFVGETSKTLEFFINGISIGTTIVEPSDFDGDAPCEFKFLVLPSFIFEAPISIRMRDVDADQEIGSPQVFQEVADAEAAILVADGVVGAVERGSLKGSLRDVNPDALPISVGVYSRGVPIARTVVGSKVPAASGSLISSLPFSIGLPPSVLDGASTSLSVRIEGSAQEFAGSPLILRLEAGDGLHGRLTHLEQKNEELEAEVALLRSSIVGDIAEQFYRFIVPRVDAFLTTQRDGLEGQMRALWRELGGRAPSPIARRKLPERAVIGLSGAITGYRWSDPTPNLPTDRWFTRSAFVATEVSDKNDLLLVVKGAHAASPAALAALVVSVNGRGVDLVSAAAGSGWEAVGVVPRAALAPHGSVGVLLETDFADEHALAPTYMGPVSLSVASIELVPLKGVAAEFSVGSRSELFACGWHALEQTSAKQRFRWMTAEGVIVLSGLQPDAAIRVELSGPMALDGALDAITATLDGAEAEIVPLEAGGSGWAFELAFPRRNAASESVALMRIQAPARPPSAADKRFLSLAVSEVVVEQEVDPASALLGGEPAEASEASEELAAAEGDR